MIPTDLIPTLRDHLTMELACHRSLLANAELQQRELIANHMEIFAELVPSQLARPVATSSA